MWIMVLALCHQQHRIKKCTVFLKSLSKERMNKIPTSDGVCTDALQGLRFQIRNCFFCDLRAGRAVWSNFMFLWLSFSILKQVSSYFSCLGDCCNSVLLWSSRRVLFGSGKRRWWLSFNLGVTVLLIQRIAPHMGVIFSCPHTLATWCQ